VSVSSRIPRIPPAYLSQAGMRSNPLQFPGLSLRAYLAYLPYTLYIEIYVF
jgi:hypothetical protein